MKEKKLFFFSKDIFKLPPVCDEHFKLFDVLEINEYREMLKKLSLSYFNVLYYFVRGQKM